MRIFFHFLGMSLVNSYIYHKRLSSSHISTVEYISSISTALIGSYCSRKRLGRPLAMSNQKKARIEKSTSDTENSGEVRLLAHMPEVVVSRRRCAYCSTKEKQKTMCIGRRNIKKTCYCCRQRILH